MSFRHAPAPGVKTPPHPAAPAASDAKSEFCDRLYQRHAPRHRPDWPVSYRHATAPGVKTLPHPAAPAASDAKSESCDRLYQRRILHRLASNTTSHFSGAGRPARRRRGRARTPDVNLLARSRPHVIARLTALFGLTKLGDEIEQLSQKVNKTQDNRHDDRHH